MVLATLCVTFQLSTHLYDNYLLLYWLISINHKTLARLFELIRTTNRLMYKTMNVWTYFSIRTSVICTTTLSTSAFMLCLVTVRWFGVRATNLLIHSTLLNIWTWFCLSTVEICTATLFTATFMLSRKAWSIGWRIDKVRIKQ